MKTIGEIVLEFLLGIPIREVTEPTVATCSFPTLEAPFIFFIQKQLCQSTNQAQSKTASPASSSLDCSIWDMAPSIAEQFGYGLALDFL